MCCAFATPLARTLIAAVCAPALARMVNRKTHGSKRLHEIISGRISCQAGGRTPGAAAMAELLHAILRKAIKVALLARQIELVHFGRESDCLLRREPLDFDKHVEHFTSY
jgi:hypothetical protein